MNGFGQNALNNAWRSGIGAVRRTFNTLVSRDAQGAVSLLEDGALRFPVFFVLAEDIIRRSLQERLGPRNSAALYVCAQKMKRLAPYGPAARPDDQTLYGALRWMLDTGLWWDGPSPGRDDYDAVIDYAVALVVGVYEDKEVLPAVADLIFRRNRRGLFIHDLVWGFFQTTTPEALEIVAGYLSSANPADVSLAKTLLGLNTADAGNLSGAQGELKRRYLEWLEDNRPYLYLTGEHLQMTSSPKYVDNDMEAKYLDKEISPRYRAPVLPLTEQENEALQHYRAIPAAERRFLAEYSHKLRKRDKGRWQEWMRKQIAEQVMAAHSEMENEAI